MELARNAEQGVKRTKRKTYKKKSMAKKVRKKGQRLYKFKGGWRITKVKRK